MNWADIIVFSVIALFAANGYRRGFIRQLADFVALAISVLVSFSLYNKVSTIFAEKLPQIPLFLDRIIALAALWIGSQFIFYFLFNLVYNRVPEEVRKSKINRGFGAIPGLAWGGLFAFVLVSILVIFLGLFPSTEKYQKTLADSYSGKLVVSAAGKLDGAVTKMFGGSLTDTLTFRTVSPYGGETVDLGYKTDNVAVDEVSEEKMLELLNEERSKRGLKDLQMDEKLRDLARAHSRDMFARGYFAHENPDGLDPFQRMAAAKISYLVAGENLALAPSVELAHEGLMNSPGHRANILTREFGKVGIGCIDGGKYGKMFSQEFTN